MDDLISRQAAIDALGDMVMNWTDSDYELGQLNQWKEDRKAIIDLPSAQPQRMKGKWERHYSRPNVFADLYWHCSICGYKNSENWANIYHRYCPHCGSEMLLESHEEVSYSPSSGADMRGEQNGKNS